MATLPVVDRVVTLCLASILAGWNAILPWLQGHRVTKEHKADKELHGSRTIRVGKARGVGCVVCKVDCLAKGSLLGKADIKAVLRAVDELRVGLVASMEEVLQHLMYRLARIFFGLSTEF